MGNPQHLDWLLEGVEAWYARRELDAFIPDLSGMDIRAAFENSRKLEEGRIPLAGVNLGRAELRGAGLWGAHLARANLRETKLGGADLRTADLAEAKLEGAKLWKAKLGEANLREAYLWGADLGGARLGGADVRTV
ncbi:pentapeptide repeat-containing protein [Rhodovulum sulfidophilum]|uniref:pentapeptide repeat-containing protein n=1 Tax=Rhodovulum sulfidophilum TaxID=35806 RepID=UPI001921F9DB|nr:pentapeptide repeat-containing protein [Rhodovulum sulfidophilum]MBL3561818.1 pentapeptide repeat-containing protein [Rhodovulum sulfidophilum]